MTNLKAKIPKLNKKHPINPLHVNRSAGKPNHKIKNEIN